jgi:uncharacterized repeat protein (TIGR01451 family)
MIRNVLCGLLLGGLSSVASAQATDLFISEYIEGSSNNKALEFYNGTAGAVDLAAGGYRVEYFFNGSATVGLTINLTGTVAAGDVFVLAQASADPLILAAADQTNGSGWFNGDDAVVLRKGVAPGTIVDVIGQVGFDPGTEWGTGLTSTADNTLRRNTDVCDGDTNPDDAFDPAVEWTGFAQNTFDGLGAHTAVCVAASADLSIVMTDTPDPVTAGNNISYLVTMTNTGPDAAQNARFTVPLAAGTTLVSTTPSAGGVCTAVSPIVCTWAGATANAAVRTATIVVTVAANTAAGAFIDSSATAASDTPDADPADNLSTVSTSVVTEANLAITVTDTPDPVIAGTQLTYAVTVSNAGPSDAQGVSFSLPLDAGTSFASVAASAGSACNAASPVTCTWAGATAPGVNRTATVVVNVAANVANGSLLTVAGTVTSATTDPALGNNTGEATTTVNASADLTIALTDSPDPVIAGTNLTYVATLTNAGPSDAQGASITLPLPAGTSPFSAGASAGGTCTSGNPSVCTWAGATAPGATRTATIVVTVNSGQTANLSATATAASTTTDPTPGNNTATAGTVVEVQADLSVTLTDAPDPVIAGTNLTYTAVVTNVGPSDATGVVLTLPTPTNTSFVSGSVTGGGACAGSPVVCTVTGSMLPNTSRTVTIVMAVAASAPEGSTISATATVTATSPDPVPGNNSASTTTAVITRADLLLGFSASVAQTLINVPVTFTATSLNQGPSDAQGVSVTITLTPDFRYSSHTAAGATCTTPQVGNTGAIVCTWAGATVPGVTRTLTVVAFSNVEGPTGVSASTTSNTIDPVPNNNSGNVVVQVGYLIEEIPTLSGYGLILLGLMFGLIGFVAVRRQA